VTHDRALKEAIRRRMAETGEKYTEARRALTSSVRRPTPGETRAVLVDASEVARMLGASRRQVVQLASDQADFPNPVAQGAYARRRWERTEILRWAARGPVLTVGWRHPQLLQPGAPTKCTREIMSIAGRESVGLNHDFIGDVHLLLALLHPDCPGAARKALGSCGLQLGEVRESVAAELGKPETPPPHGWLPWDSQTNALIEHAKLKAVALRDEDVSSEHVLLALTEAAHQSGVGRLLAERGVDAAELGERVTALTEADAAATRRADDTVAAKKIDAAESARVLGVSRVRVAELAASGDFPPSETSPTGHRRWPRRAIIKWATTHPEHASPRQPLQPQVAGGLAPRLDEILQLARQEAERLNHHWVGPDHLLLTLLDRECPGLARAALESFGISLEQIREAWMESMGDPFDPSDRPLAVPPATHEVLERATLHATELEDDEVLSEHVLLAVTDRWPGSEVQRLMQDRGVDPRSARERLVALSDGMLPAAKLPPPRTSHEPSAKRIPRPPEPELALSPPGHNPRQRRPWGSGVFTNPNGGAYRQGNALRQYRIDRDGYPILTTDGKPIHSPLDEEGRYLVDEDGNPIDTVVDVPPGALMRTYPKE